MKTKITTCGLAIFVGALLLALPALVWAPPGGLKLRLDICEDDLDWCLYELEASPVFPGDGQTGPELSYTDHGDGTFTDNNTGLMWEIKTGTVGDPVECSHAVFPPACIDVSDVNNRWTWTDPTAGTESDPDGTAFDMVDFLNHSCGGTMFMTFCESDADCAEYGTPYCGLGGHTDWRLPRINELGSLVDYSETSPAKSFPGPSNDDYHWSFTSHGDLDYMAWRVGFQYGNSGSERKRYDYNVRAVRGGQ